MPVCRCVFVYVYRCACKLAPCFRGELALPSQKSPIFLGKVNVGGMTVDLEMFSKVFPTDKEGRYNLVRAVSALTAMYIRVLYPAHTSTECVGIIAECE